MVLSVVLLGVLWLPSVLTAVCLTAETVFPNIDAIACDTYYSCHDLNAHLHDCPDGFQFHFQNLQCQPADEVWCDWQRRWNKPYGSMNSASDQYWNDYYYNGRAYPPPFGFPSGALNTPPFVPRSGAPDAAAGTTTGAVQYPQTPGSFFPSPPGYSPFSAFPSGLPISAFPRDLISGLDSLEYLSRSGIFSQNPFSPFFNFPLLDFFPELANIGFNSRSGSTGGNLPNIPAYIPDFPVYPLYPFTDRNVPPLSSSDLYVSTGLPNSVSSNNIPRSGYYPGFSDSSPMYRTTLGGVTPLFSYSTKSTLSGSANVPRSSGFGIGSTNQNVPPLYSASQYVPTDIPYQLFVNMDNIQRSGYIPGISDSSLGGLFPIFSGSGSNLDASANSFPINLNVPRSNNNGNIGFGGIQGTAFPLSFSGTGFIPFGQRSIGGQSMFGSGFPAQNGSFPLFGSNNPRGQSFPVFQSRVGSSANVNTGFGTQYPGSVPTGFNQGSNFPSPVGFGNPTFSRSGNQASSFPSGFSMGGSQGTGGTVSTGFNSGGFVVNPVGSANTGGYIPTGLNTDVSMPSPVGYGGTMSRSGNSFPNPIGTASGGYVPTNLNSGGYIPSPVGSGGVQNAGSGGFVSTGLNNGATGGNLPVPINNRNMGGFVSTGLNSNSNVPLGFGTPNTDTSGSNGFASAGSVASGSNGYVPTGFVSTGNGGYVPTGFTSTGNGGYVPNTGGTTNNGGSVKTGGSATLGGFPGNSYSSGNVGYPGNYYGTGNANANPSATGSNYHSNSGAFVGFDVGASTVSKQSVNASDTSVVAASQARNFKPTSSNSVPVNLNVAGDTVNVVGNTLTTPDISSTIATPV